MEQGVQFKQRPLSSPASHFETLPTQLHRKSPVKHLSISLTSAVEQPAEPLVTCPPSSTTEPSKNIAFFSPTTHNQTSNAFCESTLGTQSSHVFLSKSPVTIRCPYCPLSFTTPDTFDYHLYLIHGIFEKLPAGPPVEDVSNKNESDKYEYTPRDSSLVNETNGQYSYLIQHQQYLQESFQKNVIDWPSFQTWYPQQLQNFQQATSDQHMRQHKAVQLNISTVQSTYSNLWDAQTKVPVSRDILVQRTGPSQHTQSQQMGIAGGAANLKYPSSSHGTVANTVNCANKLFANCVQSQSYPTRGSKLELHPPVFTNIINIANSKVTQRKKSQGGPTTNKRCKLPKTICCESCQKWFTTQSHLRRHNLTIAHLNSIQTAPHSFSHASDTIDHQPPLPSTLPVSNIAKSPIPHNFQTMDLPASSNQYYSRSAESALIPGNYNLQNHQFSNCVPSMWCDGAAYPTQTHSSFQAHPSESY